MGLTKTQLEDVGCTVTCPIIPDTWNAGWEQWKEQLDKTDINENTTLVGLSGGGYAVLRYLAESEKQVKKVILVAPGAPDFKDGGGQFPHAEDFYSHEITSDLLNQITGQVVIFVSNDAEFILKSVEYYERILRAKVVETQDMRHFSFLIPEFKELLEEIVR